MATTTATLTLTSSDLSSDPLSLSTTGSCYKAGTTIGLDETTGLTRVHLRETTAIDPFPVVKGTVNAAENGKVYIANLSTNDTEFLIISIGDAVIGRLYAGDWMWMPWSPQLQHVSDIEIDPSVSTGIWAEWMCVHNFKDIYVDSADS